MAGGRIATAVTDHIVRAITSTKTGLADHHVSLAMAIQEAFFGLTGRELRTNAGPILRALADHPDIDPDAQRLLTFIAKGNGQFATMLGQQVMGLAVGTGLSGFLANLLQPVTGRLVASSPNLPMAVTDAVRAYAFNRNTPFDLPFEAEQQGLSRAKFDVLADLTRPDPGVSDLIDWMHRGYVDATVVRGRLEQQGWRDVDITALLANSTVEVSPDRLADAVTFGTITQEVAASKAGRSGMTAEDFDLLVRSNGMPPTKEELAFALRRGVIDHATFIKGLMEGPLRNEWIPLVEAMVLQPMSVADAIEAAVKGHLSEDAAKGIALENGLQPDHYQPLRDSAGEPPGVEEMVGWYRRGILTRDELVQGIRESRLMNKYVEKAIAGAEKLPPERSVVSLVSKGSITTERGLALLLQLGYSQDIAQALLDEAHNTGNADTHKLAREQIVSLYLDQAITRDDALAMLADLKYSAQDAAWLLDLTDLDRIRKARDTAVSFVHSKYRTWRIDSNTASTELDGLGVAPDQRDTLLGLWDYERSIATKTLTLAELKAAYKAGLIDQNGYRTRVLGMGYTQDDAEILVQLYAPAATNQ